MNCITRVTAVTARCCTLKIAAQPAPGMFQTSYLRC